MAAYMSSLDKLLSRNDEIYYPAHGEAVERPHAHVRGLIAHRRMREKQILQQLELGQRLLREIVTAMYRELDPRMHPAAQRSVLAHLIDLQARGKVRSEDEAWTLNG